MEKRLVSGAAVLSATLLGAWITTLYGDIPRLQLTVPPAPFAKKTAGASKIFVPGVTGRRIVAGGKFLQIDENGRLSLFTGLKNPVELGPVFRTEFGWIGTYCREVRYPCLNFDPTDRSFTFTAQYPLNKSGEVTFGYTHRVILQSDGSVKIDVTWTVPETGEKQFNSHGFFFTWPDGQEGRTIEIAGRDCEVRKLNDGKAFFSGTVQPGDWLDFFPDSPADGFRLTLVDAGNVSLGSDVDHTHRQRLKAQLFCRRATGYSFVLDFRRGVDAPPAGQAVAGVDFKATDDLELPNYPGCRNLVPNSSFEQGFRHYRLRQYHVSHYLGTDRWQPRFFIDEQTAKFGRSSLKLQTFKKHQIDSDSIERDYPHFRNKRSAYIDVRPNLQFTLPLDAGTYTLSYYAKAELPGRQIAMVEVVPDGVYLQSTPTAEWQRYTRTFTIARPAAYSLDIFADPVDRYADQPEAYVWIDGVQLEKGGGGTDFVLPAVRGVFSTSADGNFLSPGVPVGASLKLLADPNVSGTVTVSVKDFFGEELFASDYPFQCDAAGESVLALPFDDRFPRGIFVMRAEYRLADGRSNYEHFRFSIMDLLENRHRNRKLFVYTYGDAIYGYPNSLEILDRLKKIGIGGSQGFSYSQVVYNACEKFGIDTSLRVSMLFRTAYAKTLGNGGHCFYASGGTAADRALLYDFRWNDPDAELTEEYLETFRETARKAAVETPWVPIWCLAIETGAGATFGLPVEEYARLQAAFAAGIRAGNPQAKIMQGAPCNMLPRGGIAEIDKLLNACQGKVRFDYIGCHIYRSRPEDTDLDNDIDCLLKTVGRYGYTETPVIFNEGGQYGPYTIPQWNILSAYWKSPSCWYLGPLSYDMGWQEKIAAAWNARSWLVGLKYQDRVKSMTLENPTNNFDMDVDLIPFAGQKIPNTLGNLLGDAVFREDIRLAPFVRCYVFEDGQGHPVAALWGYHPKMDTGEMNPITLAANFGDKTLRIFDLMQAERAVVPDAQGNVVFPVSPFPIFLQGEPNEVPVFIAALKKAGVVSSEGLPLLTLKTELDSPECLKISVANPTFKEFTGVLTVNTEQTPCRIPPQGESELRKNFVDPLRADRIVENRAVITLEQDEGSNTFSNDASFRGLLCLKAPEAITVDGDLTDWRNIPAIPIVNRNKLLEQPERKGDFAAEFRASWNDQGLYLAVQVQDDVFLHTDAGLQENQAWQRWNNDSLQIYFDSFCDARTQDIKGYDLNDYAYMVLPNPDGKGARVYRQRTPDIQLTLGLMAPEDNSYADDIPSAFRQTDDGYIYEVFFPARYLLPIKLEKGYTLGFGLFVNDRDTTEEKSATSLTLTPPGTGCYNCPHLWPAMLLWRQQE